MLKYFTIVLFSLGLATCILCEVGANSRYSTKYDNIDINEILKNERLLKSYVNCLLEKGSCSPDGLELKKNMPDAIETDCSKCSEKQREGSETIIRFLIDNKPNYWTPLQERYDPSGSYKKRYLESKKSEVNAELLKIDKVHTTGYTSRKWEAANCPQYL